MKAKGAVFLTYKSLFYELSDVVEADRERRRAALGPFPRDLPDTLD